MGKRRRHAAKQDAAADTSAATAADKLGEPKAALKLGSRGFTEDRLALCEKILLLLTGIVALVTVVGCRWQALDFRGVALTVLLLGVALLVSRFRRWRLESRVQEPITGPATTRALMPLTPHPAAPDPVALTLAHDRLVQDDTEAREAGRSNLHGAEPPALRPAQGTHTSEALQTTETPQAAALALLAFPTTTTRGRAIPATGRFTTHGAGALLPTLLTQHAHVIVCTVCAGTPQTPDVYLCFDGAFDDMTRQLKEHYLPSTDRSQRIAAVLRFVSQHTPCGHGCRQHATTRAVDCRECRAVPRPFEFHSVESTERIQSAVSTDGTRPLVNPSHDDVPANVPSTRLEPIDALPSWLQRMGVQDVTSCEIPTGAGTFTCVVVNGSTHPQLQGVTSFWFVEAVGAFRVSAFVGLDPRRAVVPTSVTSPESIRYRDNNALAWPQLPEPRPKCRTHTIDDTEDAVRAFMRAPEALVLNRRVFDSHKWHDITEVQPSAHACTTAHESEDKRTVLCVCGESGIGKSKYVVDELSRKLDAVPVVINLATVARAATEKVQEIDRLTEELLGDSAFAEQRDASMRLLVELGRHAVTLKVSSSFFAEPYLARRRLASTVVRDAFDAELDELAPRTWADWIARREASRVVADTSGVAPDSGVVTDSHILLVIDEVGANLNVARALLSDRYIQRTLKEKLFGKRSVCKVAGQGVPLRVDLVLCGTTSDALSCFDVFSTGTDPGGVRIVQLQSTATNTTSFGNALMAEYMGRDVTVQFPLAHWVDKMWTNPRLAHAFAKDLCASLKHCLSANVSPEDVRSSARRAMIKYCQMNGLAAETAQTKQLLVDVAYHELSAWSLTPTPRKNRSPYTGGHLRVNWSDPQHARLFESLSRPPPYCTADARFSTLRAAIAARPTTGVKALVSYDATGQRNLLYMALCLRCVTLGLMTYSVETDKFDASPALRFALCLRFGQVVNPRQGDAFEDATLAAVQRGLEAQGYNALVVHLPFPMPATTRVLSPFYSDGALLDARNHLTKATVEEPRAVVIKNGPSAPAADIIVLKRQVLDPAAPDALLGPELQMMLIGCKNKDLESLSRSFQRISTKKETHDCPTNEDPQKCFDEAFANNRQRDWRSKWCTLGVDATVDQRQIEYSCPSLRSNSDDREFVEDLRNRYSGGDAASNFFAWLLLSTAKPAATPRNVAKALPTPRNVANVRREAAPTSRNAAKAVPMPRNVAEAAPMPRNVANIHTEFVLQESFATAMYESLFTGFPLPACTLQLDATVFPNCPLPAPTLPRLHACGLEDLGLFATLFEPAASCGGPGVLVVLRSTRLGLPLCPAPACKAQSDGSRQSFVTGTLDWHPPPLECAGCSGKLALGECVKSKPTCSCFVWSSTKECVVCHL